MKEFNVILKIGNDVVHRTSVKAACSEQAALIAFSNSSWGLDWFFLIVACVDGEVFDFSNYSYIDLWKAIS